MSNSIKIKDPITSNRVWYTTSDGTIGQNSNLTYDSSQDLFSAPKAFISTKLELGTASSPSNCLFYSYGNSASDMVAIEGNSSGNFKKFILGGTVGLVLNAINNGSYQSISTTGTTNLRLGVGTSDVISIINGKVALNTATPTGTFDIYDSSNPVSLHLTRGGEITNGNNYSSINFIFGKTGVTGVGLMAISRSSAENTADLHISTNNAGTSGVVVAVTKDRLVGINNTSPVATLDVSGSVNSTSGYTYLGGAPSGTILLGNGTRFVSGSISGDATLSVTGVLTLANTAVSAGSYGSATQVPALTVDSKGRLTSVSNTSILTNKLSAFASTSSSELAGVISDETGSGALVFANTPTLVTPVLGVATATSINGTSIPSSKTLVVTTDTLGALASTTSSQLAGVISDETGTGSLVFATSPTLVTPHIGSATASAINKVFIVAPTVSSSITIANLKGLTVSNTLSFTGTDGSSVAFGGGGTVLYTSNKLSDLSATTSSELREVISDETGTGSLVFANTPTLVTPVLGAATATSINNTNIPSSKTLVVTTDKLSSLASTTSSELAGVISDETGTDKLVFNNAPNLISPTLNDISGIFADSKTLTGSATNQVLYSIPSSGYRAMNVTVAMTGAIFGGGFSYQIYSMLAIHDGSTVTAATITGTSSGGTVATISQSVSSGLFNLLASPNTGITYTATYYKFHIIGIRN